MRPRATITGTPSSLEPSGTHGLSTIVHFGTWSVIISQGMSSLRQPLRVEAEQTDAGRWLATSVAPAEPGPPVREPEAPIKAPLKAPPVKPAAPPAGTPTIASVTQLPQAAGGNPFAGRNVKAAAIPIRPKSEPAPTKGAPPAPRRHSALEPVQRPGFSMPSVKEDPHDPLDDVPY